MKKISSYIFKLLLILAVTIFGTSAESVEKKSYLPKKKSLNVAMDTNSFNYFLYKGNPSGYQLELFNLFAQHENVKIEFCAVPDNLKLSKLSGGEIDVVVFSKGMDSLYSDVFSRYENIFSSILLDDTIKSVWLMRNEDALVLSVNHWAGKFREQKNYKLLQEKYREKRRNSDRLSPYDKVLKKYSAEIGWDWRLVAAIVYNESKFYPEVVSESGATGLMQLMPETAEYFGVQNVFNPEENIRGGMKLIKFLTKTFAKKGICEDDLINFVLASYNAGHGRIENCMKIAESIGLNPQKWCDIYSVISLMKNNEITGVMRFNGNETVNFVNNVLESYKHYQHFFDS